MNEALFEKLPAYEGQAKTILPKVGGAFAAGVYRIDMKSSQVTYMNEKGLKKMQEIQGDDPYGLKEKRIMNDPLHFSVIGFEEILDVI